MSRRGEKMYLVYEFIKTYKEENDGNSPTYEAIAAHFGWASNTTAWWAVSRLKDKGLVHIDEQRRITLPGGDYIPPST